MVCSRSQSVELAQKLLEQAPEIYDILLQEAEDNGNVPPGAREAFIQFKTDHPAAADRVIKGDADHAGFGDPDPPP